jgi:hypothetical protein
VSLTPRALRRAAFLLGPALALAAASRLPTPPAIVVSKPVLVSGDRPEVPHVEPVLAAHPRNPDVLFGAAVTFPDADPKRGIDSSIVAGFRSMDGGRSWTRVPMPGCAVDPWVGFGNDDDLYLTCLTSDASVLLHHSPDAGRTWAPPVPIPRGGGGPADKPVVTIDRSTTARRGTVYVAFGQSFAPIGLRQRSIFGPAVAASVDRGQSVSPPRFLRHDNLEQQPIDAAVLSTGALVLFFQDFAAHFAPLAHRRTWIATSDDGAQTFSTPALAFEQQDHEMPWAVAVDRSDRHRDRIYLALLGFWQRSQEPPSAEQARGPSDLYVLASDDRGETWGPPAAVVPPPAAAHAQTPALAVSDDGTLGVAWYDTRRDPAGRCYDIDFSASLDGGATFLPAVRVTAEPSCPRASQRQQGVAARWSFGGDYSGLAASPDHRFQLFWADSASGIYRIAFATAQVIR